MSNLKSDTTEPSRLRLSTRADLVRARMLERVDALDDRRDKFHRTLGGLALTAKRNLPLIGAIAVGSVTLLGIVVLARRRARPKSLLTLVLSANQSAERPGMLARAAKAAVSALALRIARSTGERLLNDLLHGDTSTRGSLPRRSVSGSSSAQ